MQLVRAYESPIGIKKTKKADLMKLCRDGAIPKMYHAFYEGLPVQPDCSKTKKKSESDQEDLLD